MKTKPLVLTAAFALALVAGCGETKPPQTAPAVPDSTSEGKSGKGQKSMTASMDDPGAKK